MLYPISELIPDSVENLFGYIDARGTVVIPPSYLASAHFSEGKAAVMDETEKVGFIDKKGRLVIPHQFEAIGRFHSGLCPIDAGYIDHSGHWVIPPRFLKSSPFSEGLALASIDGENTGYIDITGEFAIPRALVAVVGLAKVWPRLA